jgi:hypothetical protein
MKRILGLSILSVISMSAYSQVEADRDYGSLVPDHRFTITHEKTDFKDRSDVTSFVHKALPTGGDLITYKVEGVKSPSKKTFKVSVERTEKKVSRITAVDFASNGSQGVHAVNSAAINSAGYVSSNTHCVDEYQLGFLNNKTDEKSFSCVTVNRAICDYIEQNKIDADLIAQVNGCTELMKKFSDHQGALKDAGKADHKANMKAMEDLNGNLTKAKNFYEVETKTLKDLADLAKGYSQAINYCKYFSDEKILEVQKDAIPDVGESNGKTSRKSKKAKNPYQEGQPGMNFGNNNGMGY